MIDLYLIKPEEINKKTISSLAAGLVESVENGNIDPLEIHLKAKAIKYAMDEVIKKTDEIVLDEAKKHGKSFERFGAMVILKEGADTCDYTQDDEYQRIDAMLKDRKEKLSLAYKMAQKGQIMVDSETGEQIPVMPAKPTKPTITIQFKP